MYLEVRKAPSWPTYLVRINNDFYEMNERANMPNGVNLYFGNAEDDDSPEDHFLTGDIVTDIPEGMLISIARELKEIFGVKSIII